MRATRAQLIAHLHEAVSGASDPLALESFESWSNAALPVRGPFERKRIADREALGRLFGQDLFTSDISKFVFSVETYLSLRGYILVHAAASRLLGNASVSPNEVEDALEGTMAEKVGIDNWPALPGSEWILRSLHGVGSEVFEAEISTAAWAIDSTIRGPFSDLLGTDHQSLIPKQLRHATGSYYTPQWLARFTLQELNYDRANIDKKTVVLDPACGSGVFLVAAADMLRQLVIEGVLDSEAAICMIVEGLLGCDIDPLAAIQAKANLSIAAICIASHAGMDSVPHGPRVFCGDSLSEEPELPTADIVVGNPPWVNWEYLPPAYRDKHEGLWPELGIFDLQGRDRAFSKEDVAALFFARSVDRYLLDGGRIGFVVPQSLIKAALNHKGFRRFQLRNTAVRFSIERVHDFVAIRPFEGVANRTIVAVGNRGSAMTYPVPYRRWMSVAEGSKSPESSGPLRGNFVDEVAEPAIPEDSTSHWMTGSPEVLRDIRHIEGECAYRGRTGVFTGGANAVFHLEILYSRDHILRIRNVTERAKRIVPQVEAEIESRFIYPFLRGRDVQQWRYDWSLAIVLPHTEETRMRPVGEAEMKTMAPLTLEYFERFREELDARRGFVSWERQYLRDGFYACQRVGDYTFAAWKVVWRFISPTFTTAVVGPCDSDGPLCGKPLIPNEKLMTIGCSSQREAFYVGGVLASTPVVNFVKSRMVSTQIAPHVIRGLKLPAFDPANPSHLRVSEACEEGHKRARVGEDLADSIGRLNWSVAEVLGIDRPTVETGSHDVAV